MNHCWDTSGKRLRRRRVRVGEAKCPTCDGLGRVCSIVGEHFWGRRWERCERCDGKGYLEEEVVGETISYSSGKVPEPRLDVASLVRKARQSHAEALTEGILQIPVGMLRVTQYVLPLCNALEEREREVENLSGKLQQQKERWLNETGSGDVQTRGGYIEAINDAMRIVRGG